MAEALSLQDEQLLADAAERFFFDPVGFVYWAFPWGVAGTSLEDQDGPDEWQLEQLEDLKAQLLAGADTIQMATTSGHGVGKSALVSWIILWFTWTRPYPQVITTANTKEQLTGKTWRELNKWLKLSLLSQLFEHTATSLFLRSEPINWRARAVPWSVSKPEAFAGTHERYVLILFDEASAIDDSIWEVTDGAMTTRGAIWIAFGNPTRNTGRFRRCFRPGSGWITRRVNSETAKMTVKSLLARWEKEHGRDSDFYRVRVLGEFPQVGATQFIGDHLVEAAVAREIPDWALDPSTPLLMGVDVGRQGDDPSVFRFRRGPKLFKTKLTFRIPDTMAIASRVAQILRDGVELDDGIRHRVTLCFVDAVGLGAGVYDRLVQLSHQNVVAVYNGESAKDKTRHKNVRIETWSDMREWLATADIPDDEDLKAELIAPEYYYNDKEQMLLERKEDVKVRLGHSTDEADALALTFAHAVPDTVPDGEAYYEPENP